MEYELVQGSLDTEVTDLAYDSRKITEGMLFVAIAGTVVDGHKFIPDVLKKRCLCYCDGAGCKS